MADLAIGTDQLVNRYGRNRGHPPAPGRWSTVWSGRRTCRPYHRYRRGEPLKNGFQWDGIGLLAATAAVLVAAGAWRFTRRDVSI